MRARGVSPGALVAALVAIAVLLALVWFPLRRGGHDEVAFIASCVGIAVALVALLVSLAEGL